MNIKRKLATIQVIKDLQSIKDADKIELATVKGWNVVVRKGEFEINDKCVFFEIDSLLPVRSEFEFLKSGNSLKKMIVKARRM